MKLIRNRKIFYITLTTVAILFSYVIITTLASAQTPSLQQPPNFGDFNGTMPSFPGGPMGNGTFPSGGPGGQGFGDGNFTIPQGSGAPNMNAPNTEQAATSQTNYTLIIAGVVIAVAVAVAVVAIVLKRRKKADKIEPSQAETVTDNSQNDDSQDFDVDTDILYSHKIMVRPLGSSLKWVWNRFSEIVKINRFC